MGAAASIQGPGLTLAQAKALAGKWFDQAQFDKLAENGLLPRLKFKAVIEGADPEFVWALYDKDGSGSIQVSELSKLLVDLNLGEGDADLDEAIASMELENVDDDMDNTLSKAEFLKWFAAKKAELAEVEPQQGTAESNKQRDPTLSRHAGVRDANAWGDDPKHHQAAVKIQAVARGRLDRMKSVGDGDIEVIDPGLAEMQQSAARKIQAHARGRLTRKVHSSDADVAVFGTDV